MKYFLKSLLFIAITVSLASCNKQETVTKKAISFDRVEENYKSDWAEVSELEKKGFGKTIIEKLDEILVRAKNEQNYHQVFKALAYRSKYINQIEEDSSSKILNQYEAELEDAEFPLKNILHSAIGELYNQYLNQNAWQFQNRSKTELFNPQDLKTWSLDRIQNKANSHYDSSLLDKNQLTQFPLEYLSEILNPLDSSNENIYSGLHLLDNLFDFLANRALTHYEQTNRFIAKPIQEFDADDYALFSPSDTFIQIPVFNNDSNSNEFKTLKLYQAILEANKASNISKRVYFDLKRLIHYYRITNKGNKDKLYLTALEKLNGKYPNNSAIQYQIAELYSQQGFRFSKTDTLHRWSLVKAMGVLNKININDEYISKNYEALKSRIIEKQHSFEIEENNLPNKPILFLINYRNIDKLFARVIKAENLKMNNNENYYSTEDIVEELIKSKEVVEQKEIPIKNPEDYQYHNTENYLNKLDAGSYYLLLSTSSEFNDPKANLSFEEFMVTELAYSTRKNNLKKGTEVIIRNRQNGTAIKGANVQVVFYEYDYNLRKNVELFSPSYKSNSEGFVFIPEQGNRKNFVLEIKSGKSKIRTNRLYDYFYDQKDRTSTQIKLFTDRAIYRPGQMVYFKGIVYNSTGNKHEIKANHKAELRLFNVNNQEVSKVDLISNEYGSFEGSFVLPSSGLTGGYRIATKGGTVNFNVEEYKRPTFKVEPDSLSSAYQLNKNIYLSGNIIGFAGNSISDAKISYRVVRSASFPYWYYRGVFPSSPKKEIANGIVKSDGQGNFSFSFLAQADASLNTKYDAIYNYEVYIDALSLNGETQSTNKSIQVSNKSFFIETNLGESVTMEDLNKLVISCKNLSGKALAKKGTLKLNKLKKPATYSIPKLWDSETDIETIKEAEYNQKFPYLGTTNKNLIQKLKVEREINRTSFDCNEILNLYQNLKPGPYELNVTVPGENGQISTQSFRFELYDVKSKVLSMPKFFSYKEVKSSGEPNEKAQFLVGSSVKDLKLLYEIEHQGKIVKQEWVNLKNEQRLLEIPIEEKHRGGFSVHFLTFHSNRVVKRSSFITVPWSNKKLKVKLTSFRDKLKPGSREEWSIQVCAKDNTKVQAEMLLSMYDQSLDQFTKQEWNLNPYNYYHSRLDWNTYAQFTLTYSQFYGPKFNQYPGEAHRIYPSLNWFGFYLSGRNYYLDGIMLSEVANNQAPQIRSKLASFSDAEMDEVMVEDTEEASYKPKMPSELKPKSGPKQNLIRKNFNETVFFYPQIESDKEGKASFKFAMPDALTEWKFRAFAHNKQLQIGNYTQSVKTQKDLMVFPNAPRFFRENDQVEFSALISNLSENIIDGDVKLKFFNSFTNKPIEIFNNDQSRKKFNLNTGANQQVTWSIEIPENLKAISYRIIAETEQFSDGEEKAIPVLLNRMLVTESLPLAMRANEDRIFNFLSLKNSSKAKNLSHHKLSLEFTPNPVWYAIQALPYIASNGKDCSEQVFAKLFANSIAEHIANSQPKVKVIFDLWKTTNSNELISKLEQNQELKSTLIEETPWLQEAKSETEQKRRIALLFDYNRMALEKSNAIEKLNQLQSPNGGWPWYKGMPDNRYITQYIVSGFGHLNQMGISDYPETISKAIDYLDARIIEDYEWLKKHSNDLEKDHISYNQIHYLYARSFFKAKALPKNQKAFNYYLEQAEKYWLNKSQYIKGMIALAVKRYKPTSKTPKAIIGALADNAILDSEMGMYWKDNSGGYYWHNAKIETQSLLIEAFDEINGDIQTVNELKLWLLKQKQTQTWPSSKATAEACYVLLMKGTDLIQENGEVFIQLGDKTIDSKQTQQEAGTGYLKKVWETDHINSKMGEIIVNNKNKSPAWGAVYWQYYQGLNDIKNASETGLKLSKTLFKEVIKDNGPVLIPINEKAIQLGDKITIRLRLESDRDLEFVHLKDMRASGFEPINVISGYKYQDGIGYYESTRDASSNFYMDRLNKGVYVFEYAVRANLEGQFSNGISTIQCQYAPEFSSHSAGQEIKIVR